MAICTKERSANYRQRVRASDRQAIQFTVSKAAVEILDKFIGICGDTRAEVLENAITTWSIKSLETLPQIRARMGAAE